MWHHCGDAVVFTFQVCVSECPPGLHLVRQTRNVRSEIVFGPYTRERIAYESFSKNKSRNASLYDSDVFSGSRRSHLGSFFLPE